MNSPAVKEFGESRIRAGAIRLVIDLAACTGMDSTFMGTLAGLSSKISEIGGKVQVMGADEKIRNSLEDLGLDFLLEINPKDPAWSGFEEKARDLLKPKVAGMKAGTVLHSKHVLEAHEILSAANEENEKKFSGVVKALGAELADKGEGSSQSK